MNRPECKNCKQKIYIHPLGYIDCHVWGSLLGYSNAADCPYYDDGEVKNNDQE